MPSAPTVKNQPSKMTLHCERATSLRGRTVIVGCAGAGGVGQLAADLIVASCGAVRGAPIWSPALAPLAGPDPYSPDGPLACPAAFYDSAGVTVLPFRSPAAGPHVTELVDGLVKLLEGAARVIVLAGCDARERHSIESSAFEYDISDTVSAEDRKAVAAFGWTERDSNTVVRGGKFAQRIHLACSKAGLPSVLLVKYCYEGDNVSGAEQIVRHLDSWLHLFKDGKLCMPDSWKYFYSPPVPESIY